MPPKPKPPLQRFMSKVDKQDAADACWLWTAAVNNHGYGKFSVVAGKWALAHRWSYGHFVGDPGDLCVLHRCDNPLCVRPDHLFLGTVADNNADMAAKGRRVNHAGEGSPRAKLTACDVRRVRLLRRKRRLSYRRLAYLFNVSKGAIQSLLEGKTWRSVS